jgi:hypothetical protein
MTAVTVDSWGPLATAIHTGAATDAEPTWKDSAYLAFWDLDSDTFGSVHVSTSPNAPGSRRARCSFSVDGKTVEIIEPLPEDSFAGDHIDFGLNGAVRIDHPTLTADFVNTPLYLPADYSATGLIPDLVPGRPLQHFQSACRVEGTVAIGDGQRSFAAQGLRDRTWGFRDEAAMWVEYAALAAVFDGVFVSSMKFLRTDWTQVSDGFWNTPTTSTPIVNMSIRRNAAAQFLRARIELKDGTTTEISLVERAAGFFVPMGVETDGPAFGTYDDFMHVESSGLRGGGLIEQGVVHRVH